MFLSVSIIFIISCQPSPVVKNPLKDPNNLSCKNENWVWIELIDGDSGWFELNEPILPNGRHSFFYSNGKIRKTSVIPFGKVGDSIVYHDTSGTVISIKSIDSSYQVCERFLDGDFKYFSPQCGLLVDGIIENGEFVGVKKQYYKDSTNILRKLDKQINDSTWEITCYHLNGQIKSNYNVVDKKEEGLVKVWYPNGVLKEKGVFKNGINEGWCHFYDTLGDIIDSSLYVKGLKVYTSSERQIDTLDLSNKTIRFINDSIANKFLNFNSKDEFDNFKQDWSKIFPSAASHLHYNKKFRIVTWNVFDNKEHFQVMLNLNSKDFIVFSGSGYIFIFDKKDSLNFVFYKPPWANHIWQAVFAFRKSLYPKYSLKVRKTWNEIAFFEQYPTTIISREKFRAQQSKLKSTKPIDNLKYKEVIDLLNKSITNSNTYDACFYFGHGLLPNSPMWYWDEGIKPLYECDKFKYR